MTISDKVLEIQSIISGDEKGQWVGNRWQQFHDNMASKLSDWLELEEYLFATDTTTTTNSSLPWKNTTTLPKLTQIRDNLHSNYLSALFPNDNWLQWKGYTKKDASRKKAKTITAYMENKTRESRYRQECSRMLYDYIDKGNVFAGVAFEKRYNTRKDGTKVPGYIGPRGYRISPVDIVFNPTASTFEDTWKIVRTVKTLGELKKLAMTQPGYEFWQKALDRREAISKRIGGYTRNEYTKATMYQVDGFGNLFDYYSNERMSKISTIFLPIKDSNELGRCTKKSS